MPMPKPEKVEDLRINGRVPKTLDIKVKKADPSLAERMREVAEARAKGEAPKPE